MPPDLEIATYNKNHHFGHIPVLTMSLIFVTYCQRNAADSPRLGSSVQNIQLSAIRKQLDPEDPNAASFKDETGTAFVHLTGVTDEVASSIKGGAKYKVTIEPIEG